MYSLVNAPVLCLDLACHPHGFDVAVALDRVLRLRPGELPALEAVFRDDASRTAAWAEVAEACGRTQRLSAAISGTERRT